MRCTIGYWVNKFLKFDLTIAVICVLGIGIVLRVIRLILRIMAGGRLIQQNGEHEALRLEIQRRREEYARKQQVDYSHVFRKKSRFEMIRLSFIILGIEVAYAAETAFVSPILLEIGIPHQDMSLVWGLSPLIGFFLAPILGSISDRCRVELGRRRPFIMLLSVGILIGLFLVPWGTTIGRWFGDEIDVLAEEAEEIIKSLNGTMVLTDNDLDLDSSSDSSEESDSDIRVWAAVFTIIGVILLDLDADTCQTPSRAYLLDVSVPNDHAKCLSTFSVMAGLGGCIGYGLGAINWDYVGIGDFFGGNIQTVFAIVTVLFCLSFAFTVTSFREIPLPLLEKDELLRPVTQVAVKKELEHKSLNNKNVKDPEKMMIQDEEEEEAVSLGEYLKSIVYMPKSIRILCLTNLFCWMAHLCYCLYFTTFVGEVVFGGNPSADSNTIEYNFFEEGVRFGCAGLSIYAISCSGYSWVIEKLLKKYKIKYVYIGSIVLFSIGMLLLALFPTKPLVLILSTTAGIIYAVIFTIPFILISRYHSKNSFKSVKGESVQSTETRGLGTDIAIVGSMIFVAQIITSLTVGNLIDLLDTATAAIYVSSFTGFCAAGSAFFVLYLEG